MQKDITLKLKPSEAADDACILQYISQSIGDAGQTVNGFYRLKQSIDARSSKQVWINLTVRAFVNEPFEQRPIQPIPFRDVSNATQQVLIIGAGPAGLFAALQLIELGIRPIILERGKDVRSRRRDLAALNKEGIVNPESNYCFGEGGAGTYSDGKLYTRSSKRGDINRILNIFICSVPPKISSTKHIPISAPINYRISLRRCVSKSSIVADNCCLRKNDGSGDREPTDQIRGNSRWHKL